MTSAVEFHSDDFPLSPDCWADPLAFYNAFLKAEDFFAQSKIKDQNADRSIYELTSHFYASRGKPEALYRKRMDASEALAEVWLARIRQIAQWFSVANNVPEFDGLDAAYLSKFSRDFSNPNSLSKIAASLLDRGVILIYEPSLPGMKVDGAVFTLPSGNPVIGMSLRFARLDNFWFTLMHELSHIVLHRDTLEHPILDDLESEREDIKEKQADKLAGDSLIPRNEWRNCPAKYSLKQSDLVAFADKLGITPQTVAGRLRKELGRHDLFSDLINAINVREILSGT